MTTRPILIMAGGTGGHIYPALAVAKVLCARSQPVVWLGATNGLESEVTDRHGLPFESIVVSGLRGSGLLRWLFGPFRVTRAVFNAAKIVRRRNPAAVLGMGGYASGPGGIAAWLLGRPLVIHEQNAVAGLTNRLLARFARVVLAAFPGSFAASRKLKLVGNPVRAEIEALAPPEARYQARSGRLRLLVLGGSLGAKSLNNCVPRALAEIPADERPQVMHQCGKATHAECLDNYEQAGVSADVLPFIDDMAAAYANADLVICRAGALTLAEIMAAGLPAVLVPYPHAVDDHQTANAAPLVRAGAAVTLRDDQLQPAALLAAVKELGVDREALTRRASAARALHQAGTDKVIADICLELAGAAND